MEEREDTTVEAEDGTDDAQDAAGPTQRWDSYALKEAGSDKDLSDQEWAEAHGVSVRTLQRWKANPRFQQRKRQLLMGEVLTPTSTYEMLSNLSKIAATAQDSLGLQAAKMVMDYTDKYVPVEPPKVEPPRDFTAMSLEEVVAIASRVELLETA